VVGIAVATAILFDMVMLGGGIVLSFRRQLEQFGYELRVTPRGTLPFSSNATFPRGAEIKELLLADPMVERAGGMLGATVYLQRRDRGSDAAHAVFAMGVDREASSIYRLRRGEELSEVGTGLVVNGEVARLLGIEVGQEIQVGADRDPQTGGLIRSTLMTVVGVADFFFDAKGQRTLAMPLATLQQLEEKRSCDELSLFVVGLQPDAPIDRVLGRLRDRLPSVEVISVEELVRAIRTRLSYFQQFSRILGSISLLINFMLIATIITISVNERFGELAVLRALGFQRGRVRRLVMLEASVLAILGGGLGLLLGFALSGYLDEILRQSPGLPADVSFFVLTPVALLQTILFVLIVGACAGGFSAAIATRMNLVEAMRRETL
jgi:putative ABC transport system permease protein